MSNNPPARYPDNPLTRVLTDRNGSPVTGTPLPSTRSAVLGKAVPEAPPPLSVEERAELDKKAMELGIIPKDTTSEGTNYDSFASAITAGAPVLKPAVPVAPKYSLPDFTKVGPIDLVKNVVTVGDIEFPISPADSDRFKKYALNVARTSIEQHLADALRALHQGGDDELGEGEEVQQVPADEGSG